jgi:hypothetical protein
MIYPSARQGRKREVRFVRRSVAGCGAAEKRLVEAGSTTARGSSGAGMSGELQCEFAARIVDVQEIDRRLHCRDRSEKVTEELVPAVHPDLRSVIPERALATLRRLDERLANDWGELPTALLTQTHTLVVSRRRTSKLLRLIGPSITLTPLGLALVANRG